MEPKASHIATGLCWYVVNAVNPVLWLFESPAKVEGKMTRKNDFPHSLKIFQSIKILDG